MTNMKRNSKEWKRAWAALVGQYGEAVTELEAWQYMGTHSGQHEFRHRAHPTHGRIVVQIAAQ